MKSVVLIVLNNFTRDSRVLKESRSLVKSGYKVDVLALHDHGLAQNEIVDGVSVERLSLRSRRLPKIRLFQILKYFEFLIRAVLYSKKFDVLHCNDLNSLPIGIICKAFNRNIKVVYDAHEYEIETVHLKGWFKKVAARVERFCIQYADKVITVSESIAEEYSRLYGIDKPYIVLNCPLSIEVSKKNHFREQLGIPENKYIFLYQGALAEGRGIHNILNVFRSRPDVDAVVAFMGYGPLSNEIKRAAEKSENIYFYNAVSPNVVLEYTSSADFGISFIEDRCLNYKYCLPNKLFEYLMVGLPVIVSDLPEMKKL
jgi:glycosyltransferase involved in cell wall biosynthesis